MSGNDFYERFQCGFKAYHTSETVSFKVTNDLLLLNSSSIIIVMSMDLCTSFDGLHPGISLGYLEAFVLKAPS